MNKNQCRVVEVCGPSGEPVPVRPLFISAVAAGFPSPAGDQVESSLDLNRHLIANPAATFFVRVAGDSMTGAGIHHDDILVVDRSLEPASGRVVIAVVDNELTVKRLRRRNGRFFLAAENPGYPEIEISGESELTVWGVVTFVIHSL